MKSEVPQRSKKEEEFLSEVWKAEDFPFDAELFKWMEEEDKIWKQQQLEQAEEAKKQKEQKQKALEEREKEKEKWEK